MAVRRRPSAPQDAGLELADLVARVEAEVGSEAAAIALVGSQCFALSAALLHRRHEQPVRSFPQGSTQCGCLEQRHRLLVPSRIDEQLGAVIDRSVVHLTEADRVGPSPVLMLAA